MAGFVGSGSVATLGSGSGTGGTSLSVSKTGCTAGNLLVVRFALWRSTNTDAGTTSASGWTTGPQQVESASSRVRTGWLFLPNCGSGTQSASLSWANAADCTAVVEEYSGMGAATLDGSQGNSSTSSPFSTGNATSSATGELALANIADDGANATYTVSDGKNARTGQNPSASVPALLPDDLLSTVSTTNSGAWTSSPTSVPGNAVYCIGVLAPGPTGGGGMTAINPGQTWRRQFWPGLSHPFPGAPSATGPVVNTVAASDTLSALSDTAT